MNQYPTSITQDASLWLIHVMGVDPVTAVVLVMMAFIGGCAAVAVVLVWSWERRSGFVRAATLAGMVVRWLCSVRYRRTVGR